MQRPGHAWPLLVAANRDERLDRAWDPPAAYWPDHPGVIGGRDRLGGGTWMACSPCGVVAAVLNRPGSLGPAPGKRSRGDLPLLATDHPSADAAATALAQLDGTEYRTFNLVIADRHAVWFLRGTGDPVIVATPLPPGLHMITAHDPNDLTSPRVARHLPRFRAAPAPEPPDWSAWSTLLSDEHSPRDAALSVPPANGFGTVCASLLGLSAAGGREWLFVAGPSAQTPFTIVAGAI